jgi:uncharacterized membrane protein YeiH
VQPWLEHFGICVAAITGVLAASGKRIDLFGVLVLALVTAFGGGTVRDLLVGDTPVVWLRSPVYLANAALTALLTFGIARRWQPPRLALLVADAFALAVFTMIGARKGVVLDFSPAVAVLLGVVTGVAGGILRDVLLGEVPLVFQPDLRDRRAGGRNCFRHVAPFRRDRGGRNSAWRRHGVGITPRGHPLAADLAGV